MNFIVNKISGSAHHSAFTDLCLWQGALYCCFREATNHVSSDGRIKILQLNTSGNVLHSCFIQQVLTDLRDPKLSVHPDGRLCLLVWQKKFDSQGKLADCNATSFFSQDGISWSGEQKLGHSHWWLWRTRWHTKIHPVAQITQSKAYGFAYNKGANAIHLYSGDPLGCMQLQKENVLSLEKHGLGYPNESDMIFIDDTAWTIVRRDADSYSAQLGRSNWPFNQWQWHDLEQYLGGPCMIKAPDGRVFVCARVWQNNRLFTRLFQLNIKNKSLEIIADLPSGGDNSYPGMAVYENKLFISYYSGHIDKKSQIYLATFDLNGI